MSEIFAEGYGGAVRRVPTWLLRLGERGDRLRGDCVGRRRLEVCAGAPARKGSDGEPEAPASPGPTGWSLAP
jgi:hypothetical protein